MNEEAGYAESADRAVGLFIVVLKVIVNKPVDGRINGHINFCIVEGGYTRQDNGGAVRLDCGAGVEVINILEEDTDGDFFICIIARHINPDE